MNSIRPCKIHQIKPKTMAKNSKAFAEIGCWKLHSGGAKSSIAAAPDALLSWLARCVLGAKIDGQKSKWVA